jgi:hypothetical protein
MEFGLTYRESVSGMAGIWTVITGIRAGPTWNFGGPYLEFGLVLPGIRTGPVWEFRLALSGIRAGWPTWNSD